MFKSFKKLISGGTLIQYPRVSNWGLLIQIEQLKHQSVKSEVCSKLTIKIEIEVTDVALVSLLLTWNRLDTILWYFCYYFEQINASVASCHSISRQIIERIRKGSPPSILSLLKFIKPHSYSVLNLSFDK